MGDRMQRQPFLCKYQLPARRRFVSFALLFKGHFVNVLSADSLEEFRTFRACISFHPDSAQSIALFKRVLRKFLQRALKKSDESEMKGVGIVADELGFQR